MALWERMSSWLNLPDVMASKHAGEIMMILGAIMTMALMLSSTSRWSVVPLVLSTAFTVLLTSRRNGHHMREEFNAAASRTNYFASAMHVENELANVDLTTLGEGQRAVITLFFSRTCPSCIQQLPLWNAAVRRLRQDPKASVDAVAINVDEVEQARGMGMVYGIKVLPTVVLDTSSEGTDVDPKTFRKIHDLTKLLVAISEAD